MIDSPLPRLIRLIRTAATWPLDFLADATRQYAEGLLDVSKALEMAGNIIDPNPTDGPWEPGDDDYRRAAEVIERSEPLREAPWQDYSDGDDAEIDGFLEPAEVVQIGEIGPPMYSDEIRSDYVVHGYADGGKTVEGPDGVAHYDRDGNLLIHLGQSQQRGHGAR